MSDESRATRFGSSFSADQFSQCLSCKFWQGNRQCVAFDTKVPMEILTNEFDHREAGSIW